MQRTLARMIATTIRPAPSAGPVPTGKIHRVGAAVQALRRIIATIVITAHATNSSSSAAATTTARTTATGIRVMAGGIKARAAGTTAMAIRPAVPVVPVRTGKTRRDAQRRSGSFARSFWPLPLNTLRIATTRRRPNDSAVVASEIRIRQSQKSRGKSTGPRMNPPPGNGSFGATPPVRAPIGAGSLRAR